MSKETLEWLNQNTLIGFTSKRRNTWHYRASAQGAEPNHYEFAIPLADVNRRLFGWQAQERRLAVLHPADLEHMTGLDDEGRPVRYASVDGRKAIVTSDTEDVLGIFKSGYQPHQYSEWLLDNVASLLHGELDISSAGLLKNRAVAWVEVSVPDNITTPEGVEFRPNLLAATSLDGSLATTYKRTITAVVCDNTLSAAMTSSGSTLKIRHSKNSIGKIADARMALDIIYTAADDFAAEVAVLANQTVSDEQWSKIVEQLAPVSDGASKREQTNVDRKRSALNAMYHTDPRCAPWQGTAFGALQTANTFNHHVAPTRGATERSERNMWHALDGTTEGQDRELLSILAGVGILESQSVGLHSSGLL